MRVEPTDLFFFPTCDGLNQQRSHVWNILQIRGNSDLFLFGSSKMSIRVDAKGYLPQILSEARSSS
jgi:hypothetical protein